MTVLLPDINILAKSSGLWRSLSVYTSMSQWLELICNSLDSDSANCYCFSFMGFSVIFISTASECESTKESVGNLGIRSIFTLEVIDLLLSI
jgi:hypothetical protein